MLSRLKLQLKYFSKDTKKGVNYAIKLKNELNNSKYKDVFDIKIYSSWIKMQLYEPLDEIDKLLKNNYESLKKSRKNVLETLKTTSIENKFQKHLEMQGKRLDLSINQIEKTLNLIKDYKSKIK